MFAVIVPDAILMAFSAENRAGAIGMAIAVALRSLPARIFGMRLNLLFLLTAAVVFVRCYPQMAHLDTPWDCIFGCWP